MEICDGDRNGTWSQDREGAGGPASSCSSAFRICCPGEARPYRPRKWAPEVTFQQFRRILHPAFPCALCCRWTRSCGRQRRGSFRCSRVRGPLERRWADSRSSRSAALLLASESRGRPSAAIPNSTTSSVPASARCLSTTGASSASKWLRCQLLKPKPNAARKD